VRDDRLTVLGLFLLAGFAWASPPLLRHLISAQRPPPAVLYAPAPGQSLLWSPASQLPRSLDGRTLGGPGRPSQLLGGWPGLLLGHPLDLNAASQEDLEALPGVGPKTAAAIVQWRGRVGGMRGVDDLEEVKGVGPKTLDRLRPLVRVVPASGSSGGP
jgi:competence ComEA-like helix-hairpin-helix protein